MLGSEGRQRKYFFFSILAMHSALLTSKPSLSFGFWVCLCCKHYMCKSVGGAKQVAMSIFFRRGGAYPHSTLLHHRVEHSKSCCFGRQTSIWAVFRLTTTFWGLKLTGCFYSTITSYMSKDKDNLFSQFMTPLNWSNVTVKLKMQLCHHTN